MKDFYIDAAFHDIEEKMQTRNFEEIKTEELENDFVDIPAFNGDNILLPEDKMREIEDNRKRREEITGRKLTQDFTR